MSAGNRPAASGSKRSAINEIWSRIVIATLLVRRITKDGSLRFVYSRPVVCTPLSFRSPGMMPEAPNAILVLLLGIEPEDIWSNTVHRASTAKYGGCSWHQQG